MASMQVVPGNATVATSQVVTPPKTRKRPKGAQEYKGNGRHAWELVTRDALTGRLAGNFAETTRLRVPTGFVYKFHHPEYAPATTYVPMAAVTGYAI